VAEESFAAAEKDWGLDVMRFYGMNSVIFENNQDALSYSLR
jgi:hypothetical protein